MGLLLEKILIKNGVVSEDLIPPLSTLLPREPYGSDIVGLFLLEEDTPGKVPIYIIHRVFGSGILSMATIKSTRVKKNAEMLYGVESSKNPCNAFSGSNMVKCIIERKNKNSEFLSLAQRDALGTAWILYEIGTISIQGIIKDKYKIRRNINSLMPYTGMV
jgi:hypothetical protein